MTLSEQPNELPLMHLLNVFLHSGVNIDPQALWFFVQMGVSDKEIEEFLSKIAFLPNFNSYLSEDVLQTEWKKFKGIIDTNISGNANKNIEQSIIKTNINTKPDNGIIGKEIEEGKKKKKKNQNNLSLNDNSSLEIDPEFDFDISEMDDIIGEAFSSIEVSFDNNKEKPAKQAILAPNPKVPVEENPILHPPKNNTSKPKEISESTFSLKNNMISIKNNQENTSESSISPKISSNDLELQKIRNQKRKEWETLEFRSGTSNFKPIAAEYDADVKILKDPTGKLHTEGKIAEFLSVQRDKFEKLSQILQRRPESSGLLPINMINRLENSTEVKFIGMVIDKRQTSSRNYLIEMEDTTGHCMTLVQQKHSEVYQLVDYLLPDHVVIIDGYLSVNEKTNSRIILVNDIIFPDSPNSHKVQFPEEDIAMCLISDTHFGSVEWLEKIWFRFVDYLNCRVGNDRQRTQAGKIKYLCIAGDIVDGIGVYPNQEKHLLIKDIYKQYEACAEYLAEIPEYIEIILTPGDHDAVRKAVPAPALSKDFAKPLYDRGYKLLGNPAMVSLHGIKTQLFHGTSLIDLNMAIPGMTNEDPYKTMKEYIRARDLVPTYGKKTEIAPVEKNWFVLDELPDILHTGHLHKNGFGKYHGILLVNSGCFQDQTEFMDSLGIIPDYGKPTVINMKNKLQAKVIDLVGSR
ncbi:MAG: hypothetical protein K9W44_03655 [Candidatus Lokiarchaeota archaeon]|nr:hypothetical protein [Candidatus Harpocratesius repetitus]